MTKRTCQWYLKRGLVLNAAFLITLVGILWGNSGARSSEDCMGGWLWTLMLLVGVHMFLHLIQGLCLLSCIRKEGWVRCRRTEGSNGVRRGKASNGVGTNSGNEYRVEQEVDEDTTPVTTPGTNSGTTPINTQCSQKVIFHMEPHDQIVFQGTQKVDEDQKGQEKKDSPSITPRPAFPERENKNECGYTQYQVLISSDERGFEMHVFYEWEVIITFFFLLVFAFYITIFFATLSNSSGDSKGVVDNCPGSYPSLWVFSCFVLVYVFIMFIKHFSFLFGRCRHSHSESGYAMGGSCVVCV